MIVTSEEFAKRRGLEVLATIVSQGWVADEFAYLVRTPANAAAKAFEKAGKTIEDVKRVEINEAFSSVALNSTRLLGADEEIVNVNGGAVALGHPIGASGGRIVGTMVHELRRNGGGLGLAAICSGGGQGDALLIDVWIAAMRKLAVLAVLAPSAAEAYACSCRARRPRARPARGGRAMIGTVLERTVSGEIATYLFRVEQVYKGDVDSRARRW